MPSRTWVPAARSDSTMARRKFDGSGAGLFLSLLIWADCVEVELQAFYRIPTGVCDQMLRRGGVRFLCPPAWLCMAANGSDLPSWAHWLPVPAVLSERHHEKPHDSSFPGARLPAGAGRPAGATAAADGAGVAPQRRLGGRPDARESRQRALNPPNRPVAPVVRIGRGHRGAIMRPSALD